MSRNHRPTIDKKFMRTSVMSIEDTLNINKIRWSAVGIGEKKGQDYVFAYMDWDEMLQLADAILNGQFTKLWPNSYDFGQEMAVGRYQKFGGSAKSTAYNGKPECRIVEVQCLVGKTQVQTGTDETTGEPIYKTVPDANKVRWCVTLKAGPGELGQNGTIKMANGQQVVQQRSYFENAEMRLMMLKAKLHIESYYMRHLPDMYDDEGNFRHQNTHDCFDVPFRDQQGAREATPQPQPEPPAPPAQPEPVAVGGTTSGGFNL